MFRTAKNRKRIECLASKFIHRTISSSTSIIQAAAPCETSTLIVNMAISPLKRRRAEGEPRDRPVRPKKRFRKQQEYHSSDSSEDSENDFAPVDLAESDGEEPTNKENGANSSQDESATSAQGSSSDDSTSEDDSDHSKEAAAGAKTTKRATSKRNDPEAFATSISKILNTKLARGAREDPVLSRSREALETSVDNANAKLEHRARAKLRADRKQDLERDKVTDVLGLESGTAGEVAEEEKRLRKIAQRGVVKLFNAVRAAQVKGEEAVREARKQGAVGQASREEKATEMSKQGFLELINGKGSKNLVEEAR